MAQKQTKQRKGVADTLFGANPFIKKLSATQAQSESCSSYGGITVKTLYFLLVTAVGYVVYMYLAAGALQIGEPIITPSTDYNNTLYLIPILVGAGALILSIILPFIVAFVHKTAAVLGTIYCLCQGVLLGLLCYIAPEEYDSIMGLALLLTVVLVMAMLAVYSTGLYRPGKKFRTVMFALMISMVLSSLAVLVLYLIPATREFVSIIYDNPVMGTVLCILGIVIALMFLLSDFETIRLSVENKLPKSYEWAAAFGLAFTVIWLYFKVLDLLAQLQNNR